jgi:ATP-dependent Clp protease protease subunit
MSFKPVYNIVAQASGLAVDIFLYGVIGDSYWEEGNTAKAFVRDFTRLEGEYQRINIKINGPGGSVWEGLPIFNAIKASKVDTHSYNDGICFSMCAMILLAAKTVHAAKGSLLMLHNVLGGAYGNAQDMRKEADAMDTYDEVLGSLIADKTGKTPEEVKALWMDYNDHYMSGTEAYELGLVDVLENYQAEGTPENVKNMKHAEIVDLYRAHPAALSITTTLNNQVNMKNPFKDNFSALSNLVGKAAGDVNAEAVAAINAQITAQGIPGVTLVLDSDIDEMSAAADKVTELENKVTAHETTINAHVATIAALNAKLGKPAEEPTNQPANPANEAIPVTTPEPKNQFETSVDREVKAALGLK